MKLSLVQSVGNDIGLSDGKIIGTTLGDLDGLLFVTYYSTMLRYLEVSTEGIADGNFEGFSRCLAWISSLMCNWF